MHSILEDQALHPQELWPDSLSGESLPHCTTPAIGRRSSELHISISHTSLTLSTSQDSNPIADDEGKKGVFKEWQRLKTKIHSTGAQRHDFNCIEMSHLADTIAIRLFSYQKSTAASQVFVRR